MELGYQPGSKGEADSNSMDSQHSPGHAMQCSSSRCCHQSSVNWADQCPSECEDQHVPGGAGDASHKMTEESGGEEQPTQPASLQDEDGLVEGSSHSGQESPDATFIGGDLPSDSQEEAIVHTKEEEIDSFWKPSAEGVDTRKDSIFRS